MQSSNGFRVGSVSGATTSAVCPTSVWLEQGLARGEYVSRADSEQNVPIVQVAEFSADGNHPSANVSYAVKKLFIAKFNPDRQGYSFKIQSRTKHITPSGVKVSMAVVESWFDQLVELGMRPDDEIDTHFLISAAVCEDGAVRDLSEDELRASVLRWRSTATITKPGVIDFSGVARVFAPVDGTATIITPDLVIERSQPLKPAMIETYFGDYRGFMPPTKAPRAEYDVLMHTGVSAQPTHTAWYPRTAVTVRTRCGDFTIYPAVAQVMDEVLRTMRWVMKGWAMRELPVSVGAPELLRRLMCERPSQVRDHSLMVMLVVLGFIANPDLGECSPGREGTPEGDLRPWAACVTDLGEPDFFEMTNQVFVRVKMWPTRRTSRLNIMLVHFYRHMPLLLTRIVGPTHPQAVRLTYALTGERVSGFGSLLNLPGDHTESKSQVSAQASDRRPAREHAPKFASRARRQLSPGPLPPLPEVPSLPSIPEEAEASPVWGQKNDDWAKL